MVKRGVAAVEPCLHFLLRAGGRVLELLIDHGDGLLELPERFLAVAGIGERGAHELALGGEIRRGGGAAEGERVLADGERAADVFAGENLLEIVVGVLAEAAAFEDRGGEGVEHRHVLAAG